MSDSSRRTLTLPITFALVTLVMLLFFSSQLASQEREETSLDAAPEVRDMGGDMGGNVNVSRDMGGDLAVEQGSSPGPSSVVRDARPLDVRQVEASVAPWPRPELVPEWEFAPDLRVLDVSRTPEDVVRLFFDRPVEPASVNLSFDAPHRRVWFGEQMLLLMPRAPRHAGSVTLTVSEARGTDGASLGSAFTRQIELQGAASSERPEVSDERGDEREEQQRVRELGEGEIGLYWDPDTRRIYQTSQRPELTFYAFHKVSPAELARGARFAYEARDEEGEDVDREITGKFSYLGQHAVSFAKGRKLHMYRVRPTEDLPIGAWVDLRIPARFEAHREDSRSTFRTSFIVVKPDFRITSSSDMTRFYLDATHPIRSDALQECVTISPKPRVHAVYFFARMAQQGRWRYIVDMHPAMPGMTYTVTVKPGCRSDLGTTLVGERTFTETFKDAHQAYFERTGEHTGIAEAAIWMPSQGYAALPMVLERDEVGRRPKFPFLTRGLRWLAINVQRLDAAQLALAAQQQHYIFDTHGRSTLSAPITRVEFPGHSDPNAVMRHELALDTLLAPQKSGALLLYYDQQETRHWRVFSLLMITDLGLTVQGERVWVTRLSTGEPVAGAHVEIWDHASAKAGTSLHHVLTDAQGTASFEGVSHQRNEYFTASLDGDVVGTHGERAVSRWTEETWYAPTFTDLSLYRPGDTVHVHGWLRRDSLTEMSLLEVSKGAVRFELRSPRGEKLTCESSLSALGGWGCDVALPEGADSGTYTASLHIQGAVAQHAYLNRQVMLDEVKLRVERQKAPRFGVEVWRKDKYIKALASRHGAGAMADVALKYSIFARPIAWQSPRHPGYHFGVDGEAKLLTSGVTRSDARGEVTVRVPSFAAKGRPMRLEVEVTATEENGEQVTSRTSWVVLPAKMHGVRVSGGNRYAGEGEVRAEVIAINAEGERVEGDGRVEVELFLPVRSTTRKVGPAGEWIETHQQELDLMKRCRGLRARRADLTRCTFSPERSMKLLVRASHAGALLWEESRYVPHSRSESPQSAMREEPELILDASMHYAGEQVEAVLRAPHTKGTMALIALYGVRDGEPTPRELWYRIVPLTAGSTPLQIPLPADLGQQKVSIQATVIRGRADLRAGHPASYEPSPQRSIWKTWPHSPWKPRPTWIWRDDVDPGRPSFAFAHAALEVMPTARRQSQLVLESSADSLEPGQPLTLSLALYDAQGRPQAGEAVVMVIDEGALALTAHRHDLPPRRAMESSPSMAQVHDTRTQLVVPDEVGMKANPGGGGGLGAVYDAYRDESLLTAHVSRIEIPESGRAEVSLTAPQRLSRYRIVAIATHGAERESFATSELALRVNKPLQLRPTLPRYLSTGDRFEVSLMLLSERDGVASVSLKQALGLGLTEPEQATQQVSLSAGEPRWVSWPVEAIGGVDEVIFAFSVRGEDTLAGLEDRVTQTVPLRHVRRDEATTVLGDHVSLSSRGVLSSRGLSFPLDLSSFDVRQGGEVKVVVSQSEIEPIKSRLDYLITYPHGCGEQTSSRLHAVVTALELGEDLPQWHAKRAQLLEWVDVGTRRLSQLQLGDGSLPLWPDRETDVWVTYYAAWVLEQAKKQPEVVVPDMLRAPLLSYIERRIDRGDDKDRPLYRAMGLWALAIAGRAKIAQLDAMAARIDDLSPEVSALLALAIAEHDARSPHIAPLLSRALTGGRGITAHADMYGNGSRSLAFRVLAAAHLGAPEPQLYALTEELSWRRGGTTQSASFEALALRDAFQKLKAATSRETKIELYLGDELLKYNFLKEVNPRFEFTIPLEMLAAAPADASLYLLSSEQHPRTRLTYELHIKAISKEGDRRFWKQLQGRRYLVHADGPRAGEQVTSPLHVGDRVVVHHMTSCQRRGRRDLAVTDPLPAGLERISTDLATTSTADRELLARVAETQPALWPWGETEGWNAQVHQESLATAEGLYPSYCDGVRSASYLARAATPGTFLMPPVHLEFMYDTEHHALGEAHEPLVILP